MNIKIIKCPICNKVIYLDKIETVTMFKNNCNLESIHHSCYKCNKDLVIIIKRDRTYIGSFSPNDYFYGYKNIEYIVFDCIEKDYISCEGYRIDIGGGLYAIEY